MGARRIVTFVCVAGALAACTLFTDLSGFSDAPLDAVPEAGEPIADAAEDVAPVSIDDAGSSDGGCPDGALCESFDDDLFASRWDSVMRVGGTANLDVLGSSARRGRCAP